MRISYYTKLSGTSFTQDVISELNENTALRCVADPKNEYDQYAVKVEAKLNNKWVHIGWIQKGKNQDISKFLQDGGKVDIILNSITGGGEDLNYGVNVGISYGNNDSADQLDKVPVRFGDAEYIYFDEKAHRAYSLAGVELVSGSMLEKEYAPQFDPKYPAKAMAKTSGAKAEDIVMLWENNKDLAADYGTLMHRSLELYYKTHKVMDLIDDNKERDRSCMNWMPDHIGGIVDKFIAASGIREAEVEVRVKYGRYTGIIDNLQPTPYGYIINDYKFAKELKEVKYKEFGKLMKYSIQQNLYREILEKAGVKVFAMNLWQFDGTDWHKVELKKVNIMEKLNETIEK